MLDVQTSEHNVMTKRWMPIMADMSAKRYTVASTDFRHGCVITKYPETHLISHATARQFLTHGTQLLSMHIEHPFRYRKQLAGHY